MTETLIWLPGEAATKAPEGSISIRRMAGVKSRVARIFPSRHSMTSAIGFRLFRRYGRAGLPVLARQHALDEPARP